MSSDEEHGDLILSQMAAKLGGVEPLLDAIFGFLHRRTDFYIEFDPAVSPKANMGFPKGAAERLVQRSFRKHSFKSYEALQPQGQADRGEDTAIARTDKDVTKTASEDSNLAQNPSSSLSASASASASATATARATAKLSPSTVFQQTAEGKQVPIGNGGIGPNYYWTQTLQDATMYVDVAEGTRGKDVKCEIKAGEMSLYVSNQQGGEAVVVSGAFEDPIRQDESMWTINISPAGSQVVITLEKTKKTWWKHAIVGHPEIDTNRVDSTQRISEYDEATQATIQKIITDHRKSNKSNQGRDVH